MASIVYVQDFLREAEKAGVDPLQTLTSTYGIKVVRGKEHPNLVSLKYDITSPMADPLVQQCRGIILDESDNWAVTARPFDKFFNVEEPHASMIDWKSARVVEKLDGSLMILYFYKGRWRVGTSGTPDASGEVNGFDLTFSKLFWQVWNEKRYMLPIPQISHLTFMFELMTPYNQVVVEHKESDLKLIGMRNRITGTEFSCSGSYNYQSAREFPLGSLNEVLETFKTMDPLKQEGYVVVDTMYRRVKVKHPGYVAIHHLKSSFSPRVVMNLIRKGEEEEVISYFPEWAEMIKGLKEIYESLIKLIEDTYALNKDIKEQKDFAISIKHLPFCGVLFGIRSGKNKSVREALQVMHIDNLLLLISVDWSKQAELVRIHKAIERLT